jgi:hypothetical protein
MGLEKPTIKNIAVGAGAGILANAFAPGIGALLIRAIPSLATAIPGAIATVGSTLPTFGSVLGKGIAQAGAAGVTDYLSGGAGVDGFKDGPQLPLGVIGKKEIAATAPDVPFMYGSRERGLNGLTIGALSEGYNLAEDIKRKRSMLV